MAATNPEKIKALALRRRRNLEKRPGLATKMEDSGSTRDEPES